MKILKSMVAPGIALLLAAVTSPTAVAQESSSTCMFESGKGVRVQYTPSKNKLQNGKVWTPGDSPFVLFTDTPVSVGDTQLPIGAYGLYVIPGKQKWTLIVNKDGKGAAEYNKSQDAAQTTMDFGELSHAVEQTKVVLGRLKPGQCTIQIYAGNKMAWGEIYEK